MAWNTSVLPDGSAAFLPVAGPSTPSARGRELKLVAAVISWVFEDDGAGAWAPLIALKIATSPANAIANITAPITRGRDFHLLCRLGRQRSFELSSLISTEFFKLFFSPGRSGELSAALSITLLTKCDEAYTLLTKCGVYTSRDRSLGWSRYKYKGFESRLGPQVRILCQSARKRTDHPTNVQQFKSCERTCTGCSYALFVGRCCAQKPRKVSYSDERKCVMLIPAI